MGLAMQTMAIDTRGFYVQPAKGHMKMHVVSSHLNWPELQVMDSTARATVTTARPSLTL